MELRNKEDIVSYTKKCIEYFSANSHFPLPEINYQASELENNGLFISIYKGASQRACMGIVKKNSNLFEMIFKVSNLVCLHDDRFPRIENTELPDLTVTVWIINNFSEFKSLDDLKIGIHGVYILSIQYSGLYLPYIASLNNWSAEEFLVETCRKAECTMDWEKIKNNILLFDTAKVVFNAR